MSLPQGVLHNPSTEAEVVFLSDDLAALRCYIHNSYSTEFNRLLKSSACSELKKFWLWRGL